MAELTTLEEKLAEVTGLAMAAQGATEKVSGLVEDDELTQPLDRMDAEAKETEERCTSSPRSSTARRPPCSRRRARRSRRRPR